MIKYNYFPFSIGKQRYTGKNAAASGAGHPKQVEEIAVGSLEILGPCLQVFECQQHSGSSIRFGGLPLVGEAGNSSAGCIFTWYWLCEWCEGGLDNI
ncbi:hypothetical protein SLEP1_g48086 [Rubroshorea leprosula]|uniref:Uncharacterized protein n=1 Tax=Rubroshorea leprosula TaxID=152421 RepID=A0AAV5LUL1_9ROSI|nr:hypothetical protein SLEP1_g48086 [Rubroshorea leprosula]